jgi:hypothetical protein
MIRESSGDMVDWFELMMLLYIDLVGEHNMLT